MTGGLLRCAGEQPAHHGGLLSRFLESFPGQLQGRPREFGRRGWGGSVACNVGLRTNGTNFNFAGAGTVGEVVSSAKVRYICTSGTDSLELLVSELGNSGSAQLGGDKEQFNKVA
jgi:hypothetical protein